MSPFYKVSSDMKNKSKILPDLFDAIVFVLCALSLCVALFDPFDSLDELEVRSLVLSLFGITNLNILIGRSEWRTYGSRNSCNKDEKNREK